MRIELPARPRRRIVSLVPMVDVVMNLLFFFMVASSFTQLRPVALSLAGPVAAAGAVAAVPRLRVNPGSVVVDGAGIDWPTAVARLKARQITQVVLEPAPGLPVQPLLAAIDRLRAAGISASLARSAP